MGFQNVTKIAEKDIPLRFPALPERNMLCPDEIWLSHSSGSVLKPPTHRQQCFYI